MKASGNPWLDALLAGSALAAGLELLVRGLWGSYYARFPLPGLEGAMAAGLVEPALYNSVMAWAHAALAFLVAGGVLMARGRDRGPLALVFALAALVTLCAFAWASPAVRSSNLGPLTPLFLAVYFGPPYLLGMGLGAAFGWLRRR